MPALDADIAAATRDAAVLTWSNPANAARYPSARDGSIVPATGYFDAAADAQTMANARGALVGVERRRFAVPVHHMIWPTLSTAILQARLIDAEQGVDGVHLVARFELDLEAEATTLELFG